MEALCPSSSSCATPLPSPPPSSARCSSLSRLPSSSFPPRLPRSLSRDLPKFSNHLSPPPKLFNPSLDTPNTKPDPSSPPPQLPLDNSSLNVALTVIAAAMVAFEHQNRGGAVEIGEDSPPSCNGKPQNVGNEVMTKKTQVPIDALRRGRLVENSFVYRQTFVIRSYEVGFDRTASIETLANLFQETALNHVGMSDFVGDGMGTTHAMMRHKLIWVVTKMRVQVVQYPVWGDVVEIDSWVSGSGKNGMRRDFLIRDYLTGQIRARATSNWAMMNQDTRKLSKMPDDVRAEISPFYLDRCVMTEEPGQRIVKLDDSAPFIKTGLVPRLHDMDMNQHVNHVKYISWVLESVPQSLLVAHELMGMTLEYRKECSHSDVVSSLSKPESPHESFETSEGRTQAGPPSIKNPCISTVGPLHYTHLLCLQGDGTEILRGRTEWQLKSRYS